jgi:hypothetical protein
MRAPRLVSAWFGSKCFARMAAVLEYSATRHCADWSIEVRQVEPERFAASEWAKPGHVWNTQKMAAWARAVEESEDGDRLLLIDADTFVTNELHSVWDADFDLAYTTKDSRFPFNSGVVFLRVNERTRTFVRRWWQENLRLLGNSTEHRKWHRIYGGINQASLGAILSSAAGTGELTLHRLPCREWNCEDSAWRDFDPLVTRIVHVKGRLRRMIWPSRTLSYRRREHTRGVHRLANLWFTLETQALESLAVA